MAVLLPQSLEQLLNELYHFSPCPCSLYRRQGFLKPQKLDNFIFKGIKDLSEVAIPIPLSHVLCFCSLPGFSTTNKLYFIHMFAFFKSPSLGCKECWYNVLCSDSSLVARTVGEHKFWDV